MFLSRSILVSAPGVSLQEFLVICHLHRSARCRSFSFGPGVFARWESIESMVGSPEVNGTCIIH